MLELELGYCVVRTSVVGGMQLQAEQYIIIKVRECESTNQQWNALSQNNVGITYAIVPFPTKPCQCVASLSNLPICNSSRRLHTEQEAVAESVPLKGLPVCLSGAQFPV